MRSFLLLVLFCFSFSINAQQGNNMTLLDSWEDPSLPDAGNLSYNEVWGYVDCDGNEYGIFGSSAFVHFFDVTDPANIIEVDAIAGGSTTVWRDMKTYENYAYSVCDSCNEGLMIFDLSDLPNAVSLVTQTTEYFGSSHNIFIDEAEGRLYAVGTNTLSTGVHIFDLTLDPANPTLLAEVTLPGGYVHDLNVFNHKAFANSGGGGLYVYDFTIPESPAVLGTLTTYPEQGYNHSSWPTLDGNHVIMADETHNRGLKYLNTSDLTDITVTDVFRSELLAPDVTGSIAHNPFIRGNYAFVSYYHDGIQVFDISDPENVSQVAGYDTEPDNVNYSGFTGVWGAYPFLPSGTILASDTHRGFFTFSFDYDTLEVITPDLYPTEVSIVEPSSGCEGQTISLETNSDANSFEWYQNGNLIEEQSGSTISVSESGNYALAGSNGRCRLMADEPVDVVFTPYPEAIITSTDDLLICDSNDPVTLQMAEGADGYIWYLDGNNIGGNTNTFEATEPGIYTAFATTNGCLSESEEIFVNAVPSGITLDITPDNVNECAGEEVILSVNDDWDNYQWTLNGEAISGATETSLTITESGTYSALIVFSENCSVGPNELVAVFNEAITPTVTANMNVLSASISNSYQWYLNGTAIDGATDIIYTATESGEYSVETIDANGCMDISASISVVISGIHNLEIGSIQVLPNPFSTQLELRFDTDANSVEYRVFDLSGKLITSANGFTGNSTISLNTQDWTSGMYILELNLDGQAVVREKIVKK